MWTRINIIGILAVAVMLLTSTALRAQDVPQQAEPAASTEESAPAATEAEPAAPEAKQTIAAIVAGSEDFSTFAKALEATGLADRLAATEETFTVLAPTNAAFEQLPEGKLEELMQPENSEKLQAILLYHLSSGTMSAAQIGEMAEIGSLQGGAVPVNADGTALTVGGASIVQPDVATSNGVIHVVDAVLVPQQELSEKKM